MSWFTLVDVGLCVGVYACVSVCTGIDLIRIQAVNGQRPDGVRLPGSNV